MSQQINLYQPIFRRQRKVFSAATLAQIVAIVALGLGAIYGYSRWTVSRLSGDVAVLEAQQAQAQAQFEKLSREVAATRDDQGLKSELTRAEADLKARQQLLVWLGENEQERQLGFSAHIKGLARQHRGDLWLDGIALNQGGRIVTLQGGSDDPAAVVRYLRRLGQEPAFAGLEFHTVSIARPEAKAGASADASAAAALHFRVSNQENPDANDDAAKAGKP